MPPSLREVDCRRQDGRSFCRGKRTAGIGNELTKIKATPSVASGDSSLGEGAEKRGKRFLALGEGAERIVSPRSVRGEKIDNIKRRGICFFRD